MLFITWIDLNASHSRNGFILAYWNDISSQISCQGFIRHYDRSLWRTKQLQKLHKKCHCLLQRSPLPGFFRLIFDYPDCSSLVLQIYSNVLMRSIFPHLGHNLCLSIVKKGLSALSF